MKRAKRDKTRAAGEPPPDPPKAVRADSQLSLGVPRVPGGRRWTSGWAYKGHQGYYGGVWVCERCGDYWEAFAVSFGGEGVSLRDANPCRAGERRSAPDPAASSDPRAAPTLDLDGPVLRL